MKQKFFTILAVMLMSLTANAQHEYVDLGLPSGTLWATCNIGANSPEEYGEEFAWDSDIEAPSDEQWDELICGEFTINEVATLNGVKGVKVTGKNGNSIFLPDGAYWTNDWCSIDDEKDPSRAAYVWTDINYPNDCLHYDCCEFSNSSYIRPVCVNEVPGTKYTISNIPDGWKVNGSTTSGTYKAEEGKKVIFTPANIPAGKKIKSIKAVKQ